MCYGRYNQQKQILMLDKTLNFDEVLKDEADPEAVRVYIRHQTFLNQGFKSLQNDSHEYLCIRLFSSKKESFRYF